MKLHFPERKVVHSEILSAEGARPVCIYSGTVAAELLEAWSLALQELEIGLKADTALALVGIASFDMVFGEHEPI